MEKIMKVDLAKLKFAVGHSPFSFHQLHLKAGLKRSAYRYWNGERQFPLETLVNLCYYINIPISDIVDTETLFKLQMVAR